MQRSWPLYGFLLLLQGCATRPEQLAAIQEADAEALEVPDRAAEPVGPIHGKPATRSATAEPWPPAEQVEHEEPTGSNACIARASRGQQQQQSRPSSSAKRRAAPDSETAASKHGASAPQELSQDQEDDSWKTSSDEETETDDDFMPAKGSKVQLWKLLCNPET